MPKEDVRCIIKVKRLDPTAKIPHREHPDDSGADLYSMVECTLQPFERKLIPTGISAEIPAGFELQTRPKSGLALEHGITVLNTPGTIDSGYRGEIRVILINLGSGPYQVQKGQKIAQLVTVPVSHANFREVEELDESQRGTGGFGSTGLL